jgi:catechol 2,3-dioxygenase-like lactoylglutathione lyase family enzyme
MTASPPIARIVLYVRDIPTVAAFYEKHFGFVPLTGAKAQPGSKGDWLELASPAGGCTLGLHQASKAQKSGAAMKIAFAVRDVRGFKAARERAGLKFGVVHKAEGFEFANAKDPAGNSISISSRGLV